MLWLASKVGCFAVVRGSLQKFFGISYLLLEIYLTRTSMELLVLIEVMTEERIKKGQYQEVVFPQGRTSISFQRTSRKCQT